MNELYIHACRLRAPAPGFPSGETVLTSEGGAATAHGLDPLMDFSVVRLRAGQKIAAARGRETLCVLLAGAARVTIADTTSPVERRSLFDQDPTAVHAGPGAAFTIAAARGGCEWAVVRTSNERRFPAHLHRPEDCAQENRGAGLAQGACQRLVRTIFDFSTRPESNLVAGEVVNLPGRWSSYPPHHHPQPEIYHYRFTEPQGYGHAELGDAVLKVRHGDTMLIPGGLDHAQVSAPGYGMYYLWVVRHLPQRPYTGFEFTAEHTWLLDAKRQGWTPAQPFSARR